MGNTATRILISTVLVTLVYGGAYAVRAGKTSVVIVMPDWDLGDLPMQLGEWRGEETELDPRLFRATGAEKIVNRVYRNSSGSTASLHAAIFEDIDAGAEHTPRNCYRNAGWKRIEDVPLQLQAGNKPGISVRSTTWEREGERILVIFWYQLGEHTLFNRMDLGTLRWEMAGRKSWPAMVKVLLQIPLGSDDNATKAQLKGVAEHIYGWIEDMEPLSAAATE